MGDPRPRVVGCRALLMGAGSTQLTTVDDVDRLVDVLLAEPFENSVIALYSRDRPLSEQGYPDHELRIVIRAEAKVGGIRYAGDDGTARGVWYVSGTPSDREEVFYYYWPGSSCRRWWENQINGSDH